MKKNTILPVCPLTPGIRGIVLTQGKVAVVNADDLESVLKYHWVAFKTPAARAYYAYAATPMPDSRSLYLHRLLLDAPKGVEVDHVDGNGLNNTRRNLRLATHAQNMRNYPKTRNNTSGYKGVTLNKSGKWVAKIKHNGKTHYIGCYLTSEEAYAAYCEAAKKLHGEFFNAG